MATSNALLSNASPRVLGLRNRVAVDNNIGAVGSVTQGTATPASTPFVDFFNVTLNNSAGTAAKNYVIFDSLGGCVEAKGGSWNAPDSTSALSVAILKSSIESSPLVLSGYAYRVTTGTSAQFSNLFQFARVAFDGSYFQKPMRPEKSIRNNQFQDTVLHVQQEMTIDKMTAIFVTVAAGTTVVLDFWVKQELNVL